jgi:hypothetical protein
MAGLRFPDGETLALPFTDSPSHFPYVEHFSSLTQITYSGVDAERRVRFTLTVRAPFYPQNARLSTAPFYYVDLTVEPIENWRWTEADRPAHKAEIVFSLGGDDVEFGAAEDGFTYQFASTSELQEGDPSEEEPATDTRSFQVSSRILATSGVSFQPGALTKSVDLRSGEPATLSFLWSCWQNEPILEVHGNETPFKYHEFFDSEEKMLSWAQAQREPIEERCDFLDRLFEDWSLGRSTSGLSALAFHSLLANTWWTTRSDDSDWFSVWEGSCYFHSTIDVEYNDALVYFALWPGLLDLLLEEWPEFEVDATERYGEGAEGTAFLCHDMGAHHLVGRQIYPHQMEVEENADYLLMIAARTFFRGEPKLARKRIGLCRRLAEFIIHCDSDGNGFPDRATANTVDDASPALQYGKEQTYLAVKCQAALWALGELEDLLFDEDDSKAERWKAFASKGIKTLGEKAWLKDHYAVTLNRNTEGLVDPWTDEALPEGELEGWDDYSIYTCNGLLYLFLTNMKMPRWKTTRFARDIENAEMATRTPYGCRHTSSGEAAVWISQNLWRDYVAAYLGVDMLRNIEGYWDYQVLTGDNENPGLYYDTSPSNNLNFYPRGATVFGASMAAAGLRVNRVDGEIHLAPLGGTLNVPLLPLADWKNMQVPWLRVRSRDKVSVARITNQELLGKLSVHMTGTELEKA